MSLDWPIGPLFRPHAFGAACWPHSGSVSIELILHDFQNRSIEILSIINWSCLDLVWSALAEGRVCSARADASPARLLTGGRGGFAAMKLGDSNRVARFGSARVHVRVCIDATQDRASGKAGAGPPSAEKFRVSRAVGTNNGAQCWCARVGSGWHGIGGDRRTVARRFFIDAGQDRQKSAHRF